MTQSSFHSRRRRRPALIRPPAVERLEGRAVLAAAPLASIPDLAPTSDSGWSSSDDKTSITAPTFVGTATAGAIAVSLFDGPAFLGSAPVVGGQWAFTTPALANGRHAISARAWAAGATQPGAASKPLTVMIQTAPPLPTTLALSPAADSGLKGDTRTNVATPTLVGRGQPGTIIDFTLVRGAGSTPVGAVAVPASGSWRFRLPAISDGTYTVTTSIENAYGLRTTGASLALTIDTVRPTATIANFAGQSAITLTFSKPVTGVTLRNLWISGFARELGTTIPPTSLADPRVRSLLGSGAITILPGSPYRDVYTVTLSRAFAEQGTYTLTLVAAGISDWAGNPLAGNAAVAVSVA